MRVMHFVHWSRSGITTLVKALIHNGSSGYKYFFLLFLSDPNFDQYYGSIRQKVELKADDGLMQALLNSVKHYRSFQPDIVHVHSFTPFLISCLFFWKSKIIFHVHNNYPYFYKNDLKSIFKRALLFIFLKARNIEVVVVSRDIKEIFRKRFKTDSQYIMNAITPQGKRRERFSVTGASGNFYMVCRLSKQKNIDLAIRIIHELRKQNYRATLDVYGEGEEKDRLLALIRSYCLDESIRFKGFIENPEALPSFYDYYLSSSFFEGLSLSVLEALAGGNLVVMTPIGELKNILKDRESVFFIGYNAQEAASKLTELMGLPPEKKDVLQKNGYSVYQKFFKMERYVQEVECLYESL